jgi:hypothetical protein
MCNGVRHNKQSGSSILITSRNVVALDKGNMFFSSMVGGGLLERAFYDSLESGVEAKKR